MRIGIIGFGNMGRRYAAICAHLKIQWVSFDVTGARWQDWPGFMSHIIIATPTESHLELIYTIRNHDMFRSASILCEKPIAITMRGNQLDRLEKVVREEPNTFMVNNYAFLDRNDPDGDTVYNYYNHGPHHLIWDCIQLIHLARGNISLSHDSPIWECMINGAHVDRSDIDKSYIDMIKAFWANRTECLWGPDDIMAAHKKAYEMCFSGLKP